MSTLCYRKLCLTFNKFVMQHQQYRWHIACCQDLPVTLIVSWPCREIRESEHLSWLHQLVKRCRICEGSTVNAISAARQPKQAENTEPTHKLLSSVVMLAQPEWHDAVTNPHCSLHRLRSTRPCQTHLMTACPSSLPVPTPHPLPPSLHVPMELAGSCNSLAHTLGRGD